MDLVLCKASTPCVQIQQIFSTTVILRVWRLDQQHQKSGAGAQQSVLPKGGRCFSCMLTCLRTTVDLCSFSKSPDDTDHSLKTSVLRLENGGQCLIVPFCLEYPFPISEVPINPIFKDPPQMKLVADSTEGYHFIPYYIFRGQ